MTSALPPLSKPLAKFQAVFGWLFLILLIALALVWRQSAVHPAVKFLLAGVFLFGFLNLLLYGIRLLLLYPAVRFPILLFLLFLLVWGILHKKTFDPEKLRNTYAAELRVYHGKNYFPDTTRLAQMAFRQALFKAGARELNPALLRPDVWQFWWEDISSKNNRFLYPVNSQNLLIGDLADTKTGVMIYVGNHEWIKVGNQQRVEITRMVSPGNRLYRWWIFSDALSQRNSNTIPYR